MVSLQEQRGKRQRARNAPAGLGVRGTPATGQRCLLLLTALTLGGCASTPRAAATRPAADQERVVLDLRAKNAGYTRRIEELENRIFILEDQLDSRRLATEQRAPATLPSARVVRGSTRGGGKLAGAPATSRTTGQAAEPSASAPSPVLPQGDEPAAPVQTSIVAEHAVDYAGDALQGAPSPPPAEGGAARPFLRLSPTPGGAEDKSEDGSGRSGRMAAARGGRTASARAPEPLAGSRLVTPAPTVADPLHIYREALETLRAGHAAVALAGFRRFLDANPRHDYADNAQYWIGECLYDQRQFRAAERAFRDVVEKYPHGNKVPDAMLKLGFTMQWLGDEAGGRSVLESLARAFPKHEAARLASERLAHPEPPPGRAGQPAAFGTVLPLSAAQTAPDSRGDSGGRAVAP